MYVVQLGGRAAAGLHRQGACQPSVCTLYLPPTHMRARTLQPPTPPHPTRSAPCSNHYEFGTVNVPAAERFALIRCDVGSACGPGYEVPRQSLWITGALYPMRPSSKLLDGHIFPDNELRLTIAQPFTQGNLEMPNAVRLGIGAVASARA